MIANFLVLGSTPRTTAIVLPLPQMGFGNLPGSTQLGDTHLSRRWEMTIMQRVQGSPCLLHEADKDVSV